MTMAGSGQPLPEKININDPTELAEQIRHGYNIEGLDMPTVAIVSKKGWHAGPMILKALNISPDSALTIDVERVSEDDSIPYEEQFTHGQMPGPMDISGRDVLVIDPACRTTSSLIYASQLITAMFPAGLRTAAIFDVGEPKNIDFLPDYSVVRNFPGYGTI